MVEGAAIAWSNMKLTLDVFLTYDLGGYFRWTD